MSDRLPALIGRDAPKATWEIIWGVLFGAIVLGWVLRLIVVALSSVFRTWPRESGSLLRKAGLLAWAFILLFVGAATIAGVLTFADEQIRALTERIGAPLAWCVAAASFAIVAWILLRGLRIRTKPSPPTPDEVSRAEPLPVPVPRTEPRRRSPSQRIGGAPTARTRLAFVVGFGYFVLWIWVLEVFDKVTNHFSSALEGWLALAILAVPATPLLLLKRGRMARRHKRITSWARGAGFTMRSGGEALHGFLEEHVDGKKMTFDRVPLEAFTLAGPNYRAIPECASGVIDGSRASFFDLPVSGRSGNDYVCATTDIPGDHPQLRIGSPGVTDLAPGWGTVRFESEEFNLWFHVTATEPYFAVIFVDQRMMQWLLDEGRGWEFEVSGSHLLCAKVAARRVQILGIELSALRTFLTPYPEPEEVLAVLSGFRNHVPQVVLSSGA